MSETTLERPIEASGTFAVGPKTVYRLGYGAMQLTGPGIWGEPKDRATCIAVLRRAVELGVNFIDTADSYGPEVSEQLIADALHPYGGDLLIATKAGLTRTGPAQWHPVGRPEYRLGVEVIDLFQLHRIDAKVPADEQFGFLADILAEGKAKSVGLSEVSVADLEAARKIVPITTVQNLYNLTTRQSEPVLEYAASNGIGFIPWFPIASGKLAEPGGQRCVRRSGRPRLVAPPLAGAAADPRHLERRAPGGQRRCSDRRAL